MRNALAALTALFALAVAPAANAAQDSDLWAALAEGEAFAMIRHALAPGTGDPAYFDVEDCATQRNLNDVGRTQARRIGERLRENGVAQAAVYSSQWCRCLETAELLGLGPVEELPPLNSFFGDRARGPEQTAALKDWLRARQAAPNGAAPLVLVTHQVNITAMTGRGVASGEIYVLSLGEGGEVEVLGSIETPAR